MVDIIPRVTICASMSQNVGYCRSQCCFPRYQYTSIRGMIMYGSPMPNRYDIKWGMERRIQEEVKEGDEVADPIVNG